jgi:hypothetical protein
MTEQTQTIEMVKLLLAACEAQHDAIDTLLAMLIARDPTFLPSQCGKPWDALVVGHAAITKAKNLVAQIESVSHGNS